MVDEIDLLEDEEEQGLVHSFGVGHGDCTLLEFVQKGVPTFRMLVDGGTSLPHGLCAHLDANLHANKKARHIDVVVLTHVDWDHQGGLAQLLKNQISIGEYWGPCLAAFRRLLGIFSASRIPKALSNADDLEAQFRAAGIPIVYPLEGQVFRACDNKVVISMISPASRLIQRLLTASGEALAELLVSPSLPLEWLFSPDDEATWESVPSIDLAGAVNQQHRALLHPVPAGLDADNVLQRAREVAGDAFDPDFFGNKVLNDTSLVFTVDFYLARKHRRRVLLTGDQENWSYIAFQHPHGLAPDVLKAPHHGGRVYLSDSGDDAVDQFYLWLRPRTVAVSASGLHDLPNLTFRNAIRRIGATLLCPNTRGFEPLSAGASAIADSASCHQGYACSKGREQQHSKTTVTLAIAGQGADHAACLSGSAHAGLEPIVVLQQRVIEPDQSFLRWTSQEVHKYAKWVAEALLARSKQIAATLDTSAKGHADALSIVALSWSELEAQALRDGHYHLVANPQAVIEYGRQHGLFWAQTISSNDVKLFRLPSQQERQALRTWLGAYQYIVLPLDKDPEAHARTGSRFAALQCVNWAPFYKLLGVRQRFPAEVIEATFMPEILQMLSDDKQAFLYKATTPCQGDAYPHGFLVFGKDIQAEHFNAACKAMLGKVPEEDLSQRLLDFIFHPGSTVLLLSLLAPEFSYLVTKQWFGQDSSNGDRVLRMLW